MAVNLRGKSYLKLLDFTPAEIRYLLDLSKDFKSMKRSGVPHKYLDGKNIVLLFEKTSTRTRCSFEVAGRGSPSFTGWNRGKGRRLHSNRHRLQEGSLLLRYDPHLLLEES